MRVRIFVLAAFCCGLFGAAQAGDGRFPATGTPALTFHMPDDWTQQPDGDGSIMLISGNKTSSLALSLSPYTGTLDDLAAGSMKAADAAPPQNMGPTEISGHQGFMYDSTLTTQGGTLVHMHMIAVKIDANTIASVTMLTVDGISPADLETAQGVMYTMRLVVTP